MQKLGDLQQEFTEYSNPKATAAIPAATRDHLVIPWLKDLMGAGTRAMGWLMGAV